MSMGDMPPGKNGMPPGMPPGIGGMPPGMAGMPPGMGDFQPQGGMPPGAMGGMPPGGMPSFGGSMPFGDNGPPPFGDAMFSPGPDRGSTPSFDRGSQRYEFKQSPAYSPPSYSCEGQGSRDVGSSNGDGMFNQRMMGDVRCPPNGIKGHISPSDCLQTTVETTQIGFIKNSNGAIRMNSMSDTQSWTSPVDNESLSHVEVQMPSNPGAIMSQQKNGLIS